MRELGDGLRTRADMQLFEDMTDVRVDRRQTDVQQLGNFFVEIAAREQFQHFAFAWREIFGLRRRGVEALERLDDFARDVATHG